MEIAVSLADEVREMGVGALYEGKAFEVGEFLEERLFGDVFGDFQRVGLKVGRDETQLTHKAGGGFVYVCRDEQSANLVHLVVKSFDIHVDGVDKQVRLLSNNLLVFVNHQLVAETLFVVGDVWQVLVEKLLESV